MIYMDKIGHLISDASLEELHNFAQKLGLKREWFQEDSGKNNHDTRFKHYDLTTTRMRFKAESLGAICVSPRVIVEKLCNAPYNK